MKIFYQGIWHEMNGFLDQVSKFAKLTMTEEEQRAKRLKERAEYFARIKKK